MQLNSNKRTQLPVLVKMFPIANQPLAVLYLARRFRGNCLFFVSHLSPFKRKCLALEYGINTLP